MVKINYWIRPDYHKNLKDELKMHLSDMGSNIVFEDDTWFLDKLKRSPGESNSDYTMYFSTHPVKYRELSKYFTIMRYLERRSSNNLRINLFGISIFLNYLEDNHKDIGLSAVNKLLIKQYEVYLRDITFYKKSTKESLYGAINSFFHTLKGWDEMPSKVPVGRKNPFNRTREERMISSKLIPEYVTNQLDIAFKDERIPLYIRLMYWLLRSIPSRVTEVCSIKIDCLKPSYEGDGNWVIFIPTWKQSGGYKQPELRPIHVKYAGHGKFVIDLLRKQQEIARLLQEHFVDNEKGMLFSYSSQKFDGHKFNKYGEVKYNNCNRKYIANKNSVSDWFNTVSRIYNITNEKGELYLFTSHQLRHNGITDRFYDGFSIIEIRDMSGHKGNEMLETSYVHYDSEKSAEIQRKVQDTNSQNEDKSPVYFRGRILNMDKSQETRLLANPRASRLGKLGICSDMSGCKPGIFECLACEFNIPDAEDLDYYEEQVQIWSQKVEQFKNHQFMRENAEYNLSLHQSVVDRIKKAIK